jgi:hypothetical protein
MNTAVSSLAIESIYEEDFMGFEIYIEPNLDRCREGFVWSVCKDEEELDSGLEFGFDEALVAANKAIELDKTS